MIILMIRTSDKFNWSFALKAGSEELSKLVPDAMTVLGSWDAPDEEVIEHNRR